MTPAALSGLDLLATAVMLVDGKLTVRYVNPAAENLFAFSSASAVGQTLGRLFADDTVLAAAVGYSRANDCGYTEHDSTLEPVGQAKLHLACTVTPVEHDVANPTFLVEFRQIEQQLKIAREERIRDQSRANRELIRNLAHEIKNPLGGIRGAAQLLERELDRGELHEYTQVIMNEADRLQALMDRLLAPHRLPQPALLNVHEVLERVRSIIRAEFPEGVTIERDYDASLPLLKGDKEQLIQAVLNIVRNAAQAIAGGGAQASGGGTIAITTRIARQVTLARKRHRLAIVVRVCDNGPGIPDAIRERIFFPLVSGREGGSGLGLTIAQNFVSQHDGTITVESRPGETCFTILLPVNDSGNG
jgi:two-component system, NtrC family, nitrogen regulation sensor histidine kinase GlnL